MHVHLKRALSIRRSCSCLCVQVRVCVYVYVAFMFQGPQRLRDIVSARRSTTVFQQLCCKAYIIEHFCCPTQARTTMRAHFENHGEHCQPSGSLRASDTDGVRDQDVDIYIAWDDGDASSREDLESRPYAGLGMADSGLSGQGDVREGTEDTWKPACEGTCGYLHFC